MWHSMMCVLTWKPKVTPRNRLLFQLAVSKRPIEETESGSSEKIWRTPDAHCDRGPSSEKRMKMKLEEGMPISLNDQVAHPDLMWPTPNSSPNTISQTVEATLSLRERDRKQGQLMEAVVDQMFPTPQASDHLANQSETLEAWEKRAKEKKEQGINLQFALRHAVQKNPGKMYPTPAARDHKDVGENTDYQKLADKSKLAGVVMVQEMKNSNKKWPTPKATDYFPGMGDYVTETETGYSVTRKGTGQKFGAKLADAVDYEEKKMWPTPNASDNRDRGNLSDPAIQRRIALGKQVNLSMAVKDKPKKGTLNPEWVEWLMGYPPGWTDITASSESPASQE